MADSCLNASLKGSAIARKSESVKMEAVTMELPMRPETGHHLRAWMAGNVPGSNLR